MTTPTQSDEQRVKEVYPEAEMMRVQQPMDGQRSRVCIPLSGWHEGDIWGQMDGESAAWADAASRLPKAEAELEDPRNGFVVEITLCPGGEAKKTLSSPEEVRFILGEALDKHGIEEEIDYTLAVSRAQIIAPPVAEPTPQTFEEWWNSDKQWEVARSLEGEDNCDECCGVYALAAWNAAKASSPAVAGGESEKELWWFSEIRPIINAIGELSVQEAMDAVEKMLKEKR